MDVRCGNCLDVMLTLDADSIDAIVTDPPYGLEFMGKEWDHGIPGVEFWKRAIRVAKPGAHLLAFGGTRTFHRLACAIEDAGWEIRDCIMWVYGSGFPKSRNVSLDMDKMEGHGNRGHRIAVANRYHPDGTLEPNGEILPAYEPKTEQGQQWKGWGTALKPAWEPIIVARKPLIGTVAKNVQQHGTGAINIDACRVEGGPSEGGSISGSTALGQGSGWNSHANRTTEIDRSMSAGRWPANLIHDGSEEVVELFPQTGVSSGGRAGHTAAYQGGFKQEHYGDMKPGFGDSGSAARFFYCAKASKSDRGEGNNHPTVKPNSLMCYLCRLVTPPGGTILDPFMGSGSTLVAAKQEGFEAIGIDSNADYCEIARKRLSEVKHEVLLWD